MTYDPWSHADALGIPVRYRPGLAWEGLWHHGTILLRPGLTRRVERSVLAHEIVHAEHDDQPTTDTVTHTRQERRADRIAAERLITPADLRAAQRISDDPGMWCHELDVTGWILTARLGALHGTCP